MNKYGFRLPGTGAAFYVGLPQGIPDKIRAKNSKAAGNPEIVAYPKIAGTAEASEGFYRVFDGTQVTEDELDFGEGIAAYIGGDILTAVATDKFILDGQFGLKADKRDANAPTATLDTWTLDTAANRTGHVNAAISTTHVGIGSKVIVQVGQKSYGDRGEVWITGLTSTGAAADQIELNVAVPSGTIKFVGGKGLYVLAPAGCIMPSGIVVNNTGVINASGEAIIFEAEYWD